MNRVMHVAVALLFGAHVHVVQGKYAASPFFLPTSDPNMNGEYKLAPTPNQPSTSQWSTDFKDYPGGVEYFEVYAGPVTSTYSEVFWTALPTIELPQPLQQRFAGKGMAVVGFEADQVRRTPQGDVSVPINVAYNHHYGAIMTGKGSRVGRVKRDPTDLRQPKHDAPGAPGFVDVPIEHTPSASGLPTSMVFGYSNGGEYRKTYHGLAPPFAQIVESPQQIHITPMQIDTWNRDEMNLTGSPFVPGPAPRHSLAPVTGPDATYSGLLECPLTTRIRKHLTGGGWNDSAAPAIFACANTTAPQTCAHTLATASSCFEAAKGLGLPHVGTQQGYSALLPAGCSVSFDGPADSATAFFNTNDESRACCGAGVDVVKGSVQSLVKLALTLSKQEGALITITGPAGVWFGVGFNTIAMANSPYTIVVDGQGKVTERVLGDHLPGVQINNSLTAVSNTVRDGVRTVVLHRALKGLTPHHYTFDPRLLSLNFINALGSTSEFGYHKQKDTAALALWPVGEAAACLCAVPAAPFGRGVGQLEYLPTGEVIGFPFRCEPEPRESVLAHRNPTCDVRTYVGGLSTCHHGWHLLDEDQSVPWPEQKLEYFMKYRLYFQEHDPKHHIQAYDLTWSMGGATGEYDVPQCPPGTPVEKCTHEVTGVIVPPAGDVHFVAAHYHCHAPTCLYMEIYNNITGELLCREDAYHGNGRDITGNDRFDEVGYIAQRICLWGDDASLDAPPLVSGVPLFVRSVTNNTYGHHGEMALPQMLVASFTPKH